MDGNEFRRSAEAIMLDRFSKFIQIIKEKLNMISLKQIGRSIVIVSATIAAIAPSVNAQSIANGFYGSIYPNEEGFTVKNNIFQWEDQEKGIGKKQPLSNLKLKQIKSGVLYDPSNNSYWCLVKKQMNHSARCTRNGWR
jgi:hypothetical protein